MDFELLKQEAEKSCAVLVRGVSDAKKKLRLIETHLADAQSRQARLETQKVKLTQSGDSSVGESVNSFEKFQTSLRKINSQILALGEASEVLKTTIVPGERRKASECAQALQSKLLEFWKPYQHACEVEMRDLLDQVIRLRDAFEFAFVKIADDCGLQGALFLGCYQIHANALPIPAHRRFRIELKTAKAPAVEQAVPEPVQTPSEPVLDAVGPVQTVEDAPLVAPCMTDGASVCLHDKTVLTGGTV